MVFGNHAAVCSKCGQPFTEGDCRSIPSVCYLCRGKAKANIPMPDVKEPLKYSDRQLLDWLQSKLGSYTGKVICRFSCYGRGWRLHETSIAGAVDDVRLAIINAINKDKENANKED